MALGLLYLILTMLGTVKTQDHAYMRTARLAAAVRKIILHGNFQPDKFQGKWYALAMADERISRDTKKRFNIHSVIYNLTQDHGFEVTTTIFRPLIKVMCMQPLMDMDPRMDCLHYTDIFSPTNEQTEFILKNPSRNIGMHRYSMNVLASNYDEYAVVSFGKDSEDKASIYLMLYGRTKSLSPEVAQLFLIFTDYLDLTDDNIVLFLPTDKCIDDS